MSGLFFSILREDGFTGLYRGLVPSMMKTAPAISITYVVYEKVITIFLVFSVCFSINDDKKLRL